MHNKPLASEGEEHVQEGLLTLALMSFVSLGLTSFLRRRISPVMTLPLVATLAGLAASACFIGQREADSMLSDILYVIEHFFFTMLLPPMVYVAGFEIIGHHGELFYRRIGTILWFALFGTFVAIFLNCIVIYLPGVLHISLRLPIRHALALAIIVTPTDLSGVRPLFKSHNVPALVEVITTGESMFNDAVSLMLYKVVSDTSQSLNSLKSCIGVVAWFVFQFIASMLLGVSIAIIFPLLVKWILLMPDSHSRETGALMVQNSSPNDYDSFFELIFVLLSPWIAYIIGEQSHLSGVICTLFCGIGTARYTLVLFSTSFGNTVHHVTQSANIVAETVSFLFLGCALTTGNSLLRPFLDMEQELKHENIVAWMRPLVSSVGIFQLIVLHCICLFGVTLVRMIVVIVTSAIVNSLTRPLDTIECDTAVATSDVTAKVYNFQMKRSYVAPKDQLLIAVCGVRGAIAVALAYKAKGDFGGGAVGSALVSAALLYTLVSILGLCPFLPRIVEFLCDGSTVEEDIFNRPLQSSIWSLILTKISQSDSRIRLALKQGSGGALPV